MKVAQVLKDGVLKFELATVRYLSPSGMFGIAKNPATVVLCFDHKYSKAGHQYVIYLSGAIPKLERNVVKQMVIRRAEVGLQFPTYKRLPIILK